jgi:hypothetical protein
LPNIFYLLYHLMLQTRISTENNILNLKPAMFCILSYVQSFVPPPQRILTLSQFPPSVLHLFILYYATLYLVYSSFYVAKTSFYMCK